MPTATLNPLNDLIDIYSAALGQHCETTPYNLAMSVLEAGANIALTGNVGTGKVRIDAAAGSGGSGPTYGQATESVTGIAKIIGQANADAGINDTDILTIKKLLALGEPARTTLKTLLGVSTVNRRVLAYRPNNSSVPVTYSAGVAGPTGAQTAILVDKTNYPDPNKIIGRGIFNFNGINNVTDQVVPVSPVYWSPLDTSTQWAVMLRVPQATVESVGWISILPSQCTDLLLEYMG